MEFLVDIPVAGINAAITDHLVMLFGDMADQTLYKMHNGDGFFHIFVIFMAIVMESNIITIIAVNTGSGDYGSSKIASDILYDGFGITFIGFGIDVKAVLVLPVASGFNLFKGGADFGFQFAQQGSTERIAKESIVEIIDISPEPVIAVAALRNKAVNMGIPFQVPAKGVKNHNKPRCEIHGFILFKKHTGNNAVNSVKKAVKERAVKQEKIPELFIDGEDTVAVMNIYQFKGHRGSALHGVEIPAGRAETAMAAEGDKL